MKFVSVSLDFMTNGTETITCKFSDLQETLAEVRWVNVGKFEVTKIPTHRMENLDEKVSRLVFNLQAEWETGKETRKLEREIYGE